MTYNVYRSTTSGGEGVSPLASEIPSPSYADSTAQQGVQYFYTVAAVGSTAVGLQSTEATVALTQAAMPSFTPTPGNFGGAQTVSITTVSAGAGIIYTIDGTAPSLTNGTTSTGSITVASSATVNAIAYGAGYTISAVGTGTYAKVPHGRCYYIQSWAQIRGEIEGLVSPVLQIAPRGPVTDTLAVDV